MSLQEGANSTLRAMTNPQEAELRAPIEILTKQVSAQAPWVRNRNGRDGKETALEMSNMAREITCQTPGVYVVTTHLHMAQAPSLPTPERETPLR